jgi:hypothetical protein
MHSSRYCRSKNGRYRLKDKNGVEIYESDILLTDYDNTPWVVMWDEHNAGWWLNKSPLKALEWSMFKEREVIGNIYSDPELLKDKQRREAKSNH